MSILSIFLPLLLAIVPCPSLFQARIIPCLPLDISLNLFIDCNHSPHRLIISTILIRLQRQMKICQQYKKVTLLFYEQLINWTFVQRITHVSSSKDDADKINLAKA